MLGYAGWYSQQPYRDIPFYIPFQQVLLLPPVLYLYCRSLLDNSFVFRKQDFVHFILPGLYLAFSVMVAVTDHWIVAEPITITHLLTHTSGIRDVYDLMSLQGLTWWEQAFGNHELLNLLRKQTDFNFPPGSSQMYSNSNYILLALIIEAASGESFTAFTDAMFRRLGMPNTSFVEYASAIPGPIARSYFNFNTWTTYDWIWSGNRTMSSSRDPFPISRWLSVMSIAQRASWCRNPSSRWIITRWMFPTIDLC